MTGAQKRVALLCDMSCAGRCSASVALPVLSAAGIECALLPTMLLSTHTGFHGAVRQPLAPFMRQTAAHWQALGLSFDAILIGYLGDADALAAAEEFVDIFKTDGTLLVVDPAMADGGKLYSGYAADYPAQLLRLAARADVLLPNATEAALLLGETPARVEDKAAVEALLATLCARGARQSVITGLHLEPGIISVAARSDGSVFYVDSPKAPCKLFGTGDLFSAAVTAALANGKDLAQSLRIACDFAALCAARTSQDAERDARFGVRFEDSLGVLADRLRCCE